MKRIFNCVLILAILLMPFDCKAESTSENGTQIYKGATTFDTAKTENNKTYTSSTENENALLVEGNFESTINNCSVNKSGDSKDSENGTNAGVLVQYGSTLNIKGGIYATSGLNSHAIYILGTGILNVDNAKITTNGDNSWGLGVDNGAKITANSLNVITNGKGSYALGSGSYGGFLNINSGTYTTNGENSPVIYSMATINVNDAKLFSNKSSGINIDGGNSVALKNVTLTDNNTVLDANSDTYKNISIYRSKANDINSGNATFTTENSTINTQNGDTFLVSSASCFINLTSTNITNPKGDFLRIQSDKASTKNSGSNVVLNLINEKISGSIITDKSSTLQMTLSDNSVFNGAINNSKQATNISLELYKDSTIVLTNDSYVDTFTNGDSTNNNLYLNGHKLFVNGQEVKGNNGKYNGPITNEIKSNTNMLTFLYLLIGIITIIVIITLIVLFIRKKNKTKR